MPNLNLTRRANRATWMKKNPKLKYGVGSRKLLSNENLENLEYERNTKQYENLLYSNEINAKQMKLSQNALKEASKKSSFQTLKNKYATWKVGRNLTRNLGRKANTSFTIKNMPVNNNNINNNTNVHVPQSVYY